jgi:hypothetical protein
MVGLESKHTLWSLKDAILLARFESLGDMAGECGFGSSTKVVVGLDIFLDCLTAVRVLVWAVNYCG